MKLSEMILNSMKAAAEYNLPLDAKMEYLQELSNSYVKALEMEEMKAAAEYFGLTPVVENQVVETAKAAKKVTKLQAYINEVYENLAKGVHITMAIQAVRSKHMRLMYVKTESAYVSKIKKHFKLAGMFA